jgi:hypothetical protein
VDQRPRALQQPNVKLLAAEAAIERGAIVAARNQLNVPERARRAKERPSASPRTTSCGSTDLLLDHLG